MTPFTPEQLAALATLKKAWPTRRLVLIGAAALGCRIEMRWRRTNDLDLTVVAEPGEAEAELRTLGWLQDPRMEQRWHSPEGVLVDVLPVGPTSLAAGKLLFSATGKQMSLVGFDLALRHVSAEGVDRILTLGLGNFRLRGIYAKPNAFLPHDEPTCPSHVEFEHRRHLQGARSAIARQAPPTVGRCRHATATAQGELRGLRDAAA